MINKLINPDYVFEASWEVCNKVGGIYTVLSTRAKTLQEKYHDKIIFIGPDVWNEKQSPYFIENENLCKDWRISAKNNEDLTFKVGRWNIPGSPIAVLVDFKNFYKDKDLIYGKMWEDFNVDSLHSYGDYDESSMFSYASGKIVESFYKFYLSDENKVVFQAHEWMTGMGALYIKKNLPQVATIFTTHATSIGRSIAGNNKPLYDNLNYFNGDQMAYELNMEAKHSIEKQTAHNVDCFTTVSQITDNECKALLGKPADVILMNGFEDDFVPSGSEFTKRRRDARKVMLNVANKLMGTELNDDTLIVCTSGRYEFKNKGIDLYIESLNQLSNSGELGDREILAFITVPAWCGAPRKELIERIENDDKSNESLYKPFITHSLNNMNEDRILGMFNYLGINNSKNSKVKYIFVPCYLDGNDGVINLSYYDFIIGADLTVYPSYYEPWGYTPLESVAFHIPTITTDLAGFGLWSETLKGKENTIESGVKVVHRSDFNYFDAAKEVKDTILQFYRLSDDDVKKTRTNATRISEKALWKHFITYYYEAYDIALNNAYNRLNK